MEWILYVNDDEIIKRNLLLTTKNKKTDDIN